MGRFWAACKRQESVWVGVAQENGHSVGAVDNLRCLAEAIELYRVQGLSSDAAAALVTRVVADFALRSISTHSEAFCEVVRLAQASEAGDTAEAAAVGAKKLCRTSRILEELTIQQEARGSTFKRRRGSRDTLSVKINLACHRC